jgi:hypothetical protein
MTEKPNDRTLDEFYKMLEEKDLYEKDINPDIFEENNVKLCKEVHNKTNNSYDIKILDNNKGSHNYVIETSRIGINSYKKIIIL